MTIPHECKAILHILVNHHSDPTAGILRAVQQQGTIELHELMDHIARIEPGLEEIYALLGARPEKSFWRTEVFPIIRQELDRRQRAEQPQKGPGRGPVQL